MALSPSRSILNSQKVLGTDPIGGIEGDFQKFGNQWGHVLNSHAGYDCTGAKTHSPANKSRVNLGEVREVPVVSACCLSDGGGPERGAKTGAGNRRQGQRNHWIGTNTIQFVALNHPEQTLGFAGQTGQESPYFYDSLSILRMTQVEKD